MADTTADLRLLAAVTLLATLLLTTGVADDSVLRIVIGVPFLVLVPGYAILAACVPSAGPRVDTNARPDGVNSRLRRRLSGLEWWAISIAISLLVVPGIVAALIVAPVEYGTASLGGLIGFVSGAALAIASIRRSGLPPETRYHASPREWVRGVVDGVTITTTTDAALTVGLAVAVLLVLGSGAYAIDAGQQGTDHTELYLLTENESGEYVASGYPEVVDPDESIPIAIGIGNEEGTNVEYTVVVQQ
ncbi:DUF1616 domain-containing protein, partial [Halosolutus amylolyticus]